MSHKLLLVSFGISMAILILICIGLLYVLNRSRLELRATTSMWKLVIDKLPILFFVKDADNENRYLMCNKANGDFLGMPAEFVIGKTTEEIHPPSPEFDSYIECERRILAENITVRSIEHFPDSKGFPIEFEKIEIPVIGANNKRLLVGVAFDVSDREQNLRLSEISAHMLAEIAVEPNFSKVLDIIAKTAIRILHCERVIFSKIDENGRLRFLHEKSPDGSTILQLSSVVALHEDIWNHYIDRLKCNEIISFDCMDTYPENIPLLKDFPQYKKASAVAIPIFIADKFYGIMVVSFASSHIFSDIEKRIFTAMVDCIVIVEKKNRLDLELKDFQKKQNRQIQEKLALNECMNAFMKSDCMNVPFENILEIIREYLGASLCYIVKLDTQQNRETCIAEVVSGGAQKFIKNEDSISSEDILPKYEELQSKDIIFSEDLTSEKSQANFSEQLRKIIASQNMKSGWTCVLKPEGNMWGVLGILYNDKSAMSPSPDDESFVRAAAQLISLILMRSMSLDKVIEMKDNLSSALEQSKAAEKAKSYFLASMSHEIRTPLNAVIGFTELMKDSSMDKDTQRECLENIYSSGNALLQLINDILDLSKLEADQMQILSQRTDFPRFCSDVCRPFQHILERKMLNLLVDIPDSMPLLMLDQLRIRQILFNLVGNSVKFTKEGYVRVKATFTETSIYEGALLLSVSDTGIGILKADQKKLFEPFVQVSKMRGTNASNSGTGLGLVIVRKLVDKMGGSITLESTEGVGSTFSILLPRVKIYGKEDIDTVAKQRVLPTNKALDNSALKHIEVLVVDDVTMNTKILQTMLNRLDVDSVTSNSGKLALEKLKIKHFDWVLTDLVMKEMNGVELATEIRKNPAYNDIKIGLVAADSDALAFDKKLFESVFIKPVDITQLQKCLLGK